MGSLRLFVIIFISIILIIGFASDKPNISGEQSATPTNGNRILNLYDAFGENIGEAVFDFGFSAYIEYNGKIILFDSGTDAEIFKQNVAAFGIDLKNVDFAVASHSHSDHISGFDYLLEVNPDVKLYLPKDFFGLGAPIPFRVTGTEPEETKTLPKEMQYFNGEKEAFEIKPSGRFRNANVEYITENTVIADGINLIVTASPFLGYFTRYPNLTADGEPADSKTNFIGLPELSLVLDSDEGQVLVVGCSHSTVEEIVRESIAHTGKQIKLVMGGYHLLPYKSDELTEMASRLKGELGVKSVAPSHCTGHLAFKILKEAYQDNYVPAGLGAEIPF